MDDFVGLVVLVTLADGQVVEGRIEAVASEANLMLLRNAGIQISTEGGAT